jgi:heterogeneous nuclear rnp K-like protein 2
VIPGGLQCIPYCPQPAGGQFGQHGRRVDHGRAQFTPPNAYSQSHAPQQQPAVPMHYGGSPAVAGYGPQQPQQVGHVPQAQHAGPVSQPVLAGQPLTQQIFIPNDMVGAIIGKGGAKINEIRSLSGAVIKINVRLA